MKRAVIFLVLGFLLGSLLGVQPLPIGAAAGAAQSGLLRVSVINPDRAVLHVALDPRIPRNAVMIYHGADVVIYNATNIISTPVPYATITPIVTVTPAASPTVTPAASPTVTPVAIMRATVRKFPRLLVVNRPGGGDQVGAVGYGAVLEIVEERNWWGRIDGPMAGWIDLTWCEVTHE